MILGVSSVWGPVKGLQDYIRLSERLADDEVIVLVGISEKQMSLLPKNIIGLPRTDSVRYLVQLYNRADVTLSLSVAETFGLTIAESFACGTPSIVYDQTALPDLIEENTGYVVSPGDIDGLYGAIRKVKENGKSHYSVCCRELAEKKYDLQKSYIDYIHLYEKILHE